MKELEPLPPSPLRHALSVLAPAARVYFYEDSKDFHTLWQLDETLLSPEKPLVVVATSDPMPGVDAARNLGSWVTIESWLLVCATRRSQMPKVHLLDLRKPDSIAGPSAKLEDLALNWLIHYHSSPADFLPYEFLNRFVDDIRATANWPTGNRSVMKPGKAFRLIRTVAAPKAEALDHHTTSNELGAMIMRAGLPTGLRERLSLCGSVEPPNDVDRAYDFAAQRLCDVLLATQHLESLFPLRDKIKKDVNDFLFPEPKLILVDDRHNAGYTQVLSTALGWSVEGHTGIFSGSAEDGTLESGEPAFILGRDYQTLRLEHSRYAFDADVLFLDLRLWRTPEAGEHALSIYERIATECKLTIEVSEQDDDDEVSHRRLATLPRLLAKIDPGLPIILFSSTQHRSVIQAIRDTPSIISDFAKPYVGGEHSDEYRPETVMKSLDVAFRKAAEMVEVGRVWKEAVNRWTWPNDELPKLRWLPEASGWAAVSLSRPEDEPTNWLRKKWLPLAQRGEYALAAAAPWLYLSGHLGRARLDMLCRPASGSRDPDHLLGLRRQMRDMLDSDSADSREATHLLGLLRQMQDMLDSDGADSREAHYLLGLLRQMQEVPLNGVIDRRSARAFAVVAGCAFVRLISLWTEP